IQYTGLRPGEKLYEEVLSSKENSLPTHHPKILRASVREFDSQQVVSTIDELHAKCEIQDNDSVIQLLKKLIPEFKSMNSKYSKYD
ncbi:MAG: polysaccharide biosynthesis protein, partial [Flavobacteriales bacterium]